MRRVLVANRGEVALRVIRAARDLGLETVAVYSEVDRGARHTRLADRALCIGPGSSSMSYLDRGALLAVAEGTGCDAVHPGYGFLAEDREFAAACQEAGLTFVGPSPETIGLMGDKAEARRTVRAAGVPVVAGSQDVIANLEDAMSLAKDTGYPIVLKARAGGGGRGMRIVDDPEALAGSYRAASREAEGAFGDGTLYLEKYLEKVQHVEVQVLADRRGHVSHLGERDCSVQRRHQKLIEEAPSPSLAPERRQELGELAVRVAQAARYEGAGTVEFLHSEDHLYFIEMNTRIQVEHPVTEMVTGVDLVEWQLRIAAGESLDLPAEGVPLRGHALECRVTAESVEQGFLPVPGTVNRFVIPGGPGIRVDTHCEDGTVISPYYDSLVAKVIAHGENRDQAIRRMSRALGEFEVEGIPTTLGFLLRILQVESFLAGKFCTSLVEELTSDK